MAWRLVPPAKPSLQSEQSLIIQPRAHFMITAALKGHGVICGRHHVAEASRRKLWSIVRLIFESGMAALEYENTTSGHRCTPYKTLNRLSDLIVHGTDRNLPHFRGRLYQIARIYR